MDVVVRGLSCAGCSPHQCTSYSCRLGAVQCVSAVNSACWAHEDRSQVSSVHVSWQAANEDVCLT